MQKKKFYEKKWFMWIWLICFPPVGIILMWLTQKEMKKKTKIIFTVIFLLWFLLLKAATSSSPSTTQNDNLSDNTKVEEKQIEESTVIETEKNNEEVSVAIESEVESQTEIESTTEVKSVEHRTGMYGISDKDINSIDTYFSVSDVRNDVTGKWRISTIAENIDIEYYALSYYKTYFMDDSEIHAIVNFTRRTTTRITCMGNMLNVSILEYVDKEEHDAKALFGGMLIRDFYVYIDNGDIELIGNKEDIIDTQEVELIDIELSEDDFIADVKEAIKGDVGVDEKISKVTFENGDLCVYVDFSKMDPTPLTKEDMALARTSTITDSILELTQYEPMWKTITIDFGEVGYIKNGKDNIEESILGKCFDDVNFVIEH